MRLHPLLSMIIVLMSVNIGVSEDPPITAGATAAKQLEGAWSGSWGGGERDGTVFQPVLANMLIRGDKIEMSGFGAGDQLWGLVKVDPIAKIVKVTLARTETAPSRVIEFRYELAADSLTLTDSDNISVQLQKRRFEREPMADVRLELVVATGIDDQGNLLITEYGAYKIGRTDGIFYEPMTRAMKTQDTATFVVGENGLKKITVDEARKLLQPASPIAIAYRNEVTPTLTTSREFQTRLGSPEPDSEASLLMLSRTIRVGTLVFVFPARPAVVEP